MYNSVISCQVKDENPYLDEWIDYNLRIGFDHIVIYDNESSIPVENIWGDKVTVIKELRAFESSEIDNCHNDTLKNFKTNWIARIDLDEFIVLLPPFKNINELLENYKEFGGLGINWRIFGSSGHEIRPEGLVTDNYLYRCDDSFTGVNGGNSHIKTIIRTEFCTQIHHAHFCRSIKLLVNEDYVPYTDAWSQSSRNKTVIHHYLAKSKEEWTRKQELWRGRFPFRTNNDFDEINNNSTVYDETLKDFKLKI